MNHRRIALTAVLASALLAGGLVEAFPAADFSVRSWRKLLINIAGNTLTAITRERGHVLRRDDVRALGMAMLKEAIAVGQAEGVALADDLDHRAVRPRSDCCRSRAGIRVWSRP